MLNYIGILLSIVLLLVGIVFTVIISNKDATPKDKLDSLSTYAYAYLGVGIFLLIIIIVLKFNEKIEWTGTFYYLPIPLVLIGISGYLLALKGSTLDDTALLSELIKLSVGTISVGSFMLGLTGGCSFVNEIRVISSHSKK